MRKTLTLPPGRAAARPRAATPATLPATLPPTRRPRAAPAAGPDPWPPRRQDEAPPIRWARRPLITGSGRRLLAVRQTPEGRVEVLAAKVGAPVWVSAESVLSPERAAEWARSFFFV